MISHFCTLFCLEDTITELKSLQINYCSSLNKLRSLRQELQDLELKLKESYNEKEELSQILQKNINKR